MDWEYLRRKNEDELDRLNLPKVGGKVKVLVFDKYTPYKVDIFPDMTIFPIEKRFGMHGTYAAQIIKMIYDNIELHGCGFDYPVSQVIDYAIENNIKIISASINFDRGREEEKALKRYYEWGGIFVTSAGNDDDREVKYPGSSKYTIAVSATNVEDCDGPEITITADSLWYVRNKRPGMYHVFNGTSAACPVIAGCVCYIVDRYPQWNLDDVVRFLQQNSTTEMKSLEEYERFFSFPNDFGEGETMKLRTGKIQFAVIHHSSKLNEYTAEEVLKVHKARGFATYGYNKLIEPDGKVVQGRDPKYKGAHTYVESGEIEEERQYWNENALGYCLVWDGDTKPFPDIMYKSLAKELIKDGFTPAQIRLHGEVDATRCPGRYFDKNKLIQWMEVEMNLSKKDYEGHWAELNIDWVKEKGIMSGYTDGTFKPNQFVTRAELATVIRRLIEGGFIK